LAEGVNVEVLDPRTLVPFDYGAVLASVGKTGHLVVVDEARECCSAASQIAAAVAEQGFSLLKGPIRRVTTPNVAICYAPNAEAHVIPGEAGSPTSCRTSTSSSPRSGGPARKRASSSTAQDRETRCAGSTSTAARPTAR
jgi:acetoin:2,6-dichlorophenolindophenol oxidoreductase subunit beta